MGAQKNAKSKPKRKKKKKFVGFEKFEFILVGKSLNLVVILRGKRVEMSSKFELIDFIIN